MSFQGYNKKTFFAIRREIDTTQAIALDRAVADAMKRSPRSAEEVNLSLSLVARDHFFYNAVTFNAERRNLQDNHSHILEPVLPSSLLPVVRKVESVRHIDDHGWKGIALLMEDEDGLLGSENRSYLQRINTSVRLVRKFLPYIRLASTSIEHDIPALLSEMTSAVTDTLNTLTLQPVSTPYPEYMPASMQEALGFQSEAQHGTPQTPEN